MRRLRNRVAAAILVLVALALAVAFSHFFLFYYRDNFSTHLPIKAITAAAFREGRIPLWNFASGGGQPLAGNPNFLTFYPDNILYLFVDPVTAFNLHFVLHLAIAFLAMRFLLLTLRCSRSRANLGATLYLLSGVVLSMAAFYNLVVAAALLPLALALLHRLLDEPTMRRAFGLGIVWGLFGLMAEPIIVASVAIASVVLSIGRLRAVGLRWVVVAVTSLLVAAPQLIAFREIVAGTERGMRHFSVETTLAASVAPLRTLEMLLGPFFGRLTDLTSNGFVQSAPRDWGPTLFISLFIAPLLLSGLLQRSSGMTRRYQILALVALFISFGKSNPLVAATLEVIPVMRFARYPEKLALPICVAAIVLIARWLEKESLDRRDRVVLFVTLLISLATIAYARETGAMSMLRAATGFFAVLLLSTISYLFEPAARFRAQAAVLISLAVLWGMRTLPVDLRSRYVIAPGLTRLLSGSRVIYADQLDPFDLQVAEERDVYRTRARTGEPLFGALKGIDYALDSSPDGLSSLMTRVVRERFMQAAPDVAVRYAKIEGAGFIVARSEIASPDLEHVGNDADTDASLLVYRVRNSAPSVAFAGEVATVRSVGDAIKLIEEGHFDPQKQTIAPPRIIQPAADRRLSNIRRSGDSILFHVTSAAQSTVVVNQTYFAAWRASTGGRSLGIFPANIDRLGVVVPAGDHEVTVQFGRRRAAIDIAFAISTLVMLSELLLLAGALRRTSSDPAG